MDALVVGGLSKASNRKWIYDVGRAVKPYFSDVAIVHYDHWNVDVWFTIIFWRA